MANTKFSTSEIYKLHALVIRIDRIAKEILIRHVGVNYIDFLMLLVVDDKPEFNQQDIANYINVTKSAVSKRIEILVKKGFLKRVEDETNRRCNNLNLTPKGKTVLEKCSSLLKEASEPLFSSLGDYRQLFNQYIDDMLLKLEIYNPGN